MKMAVAALATIMLAGCAGPGGLASTAGVTGDEKGGKVSYAEGQMPMASSAATAHCAKFGKKARIIRMTPAAEGGEIGFDCR
jgi:hypothetical protein